MAFNEKRLYLIPSTLGDSEVSRVIPAYNLEVIQRLNHFVVEEEKTARRFLIRCGYKRMDEVFFYLLNEHTTDSEIPSLLSDSGSSDIGLLSEAGLPAIADPGARLVQEAFATNLTVVPLTGPSSLMLALMASGLNGQQFAFNGYLPVKPNERTTRIKFIEKRSESEHQSQIFIEAPYRNNQLFGALLQNLRPSTRLCLAMNLTLPNEYIRTKTVLQWKNEAPPDMKKQPAVFIIQA